MCLVVRIISTPTQPSHSLEHANICANVSQDLPVMREGPWKCTDMCKRVCLQVLVCVCACVSTYFTVHSTVSTYFIVFLTCQFRGNEDSDQMDTLSIKPWSSA